MSAGITTAQAPSGRGRRGGNSQDFELNLASIIDCFTVLIAFMLATASFLSIGILDAGVAAAGATANTGTPPPVNLSLEIKADHTIVFKVTGKENTNHVIAAKGGEWDYDTLKGQLDGFKAKWTAVNATTLLAENGVEYKDVVKTMEATKKSIPVVMLGGF